jgi:hypothetical protein
MKDEILQKIAAELKTPIESERQAVYILVEIRKILELAELKNEFPAFTLHCDWAVHPRLDRRQAKQLITRIDELLDKFTLEEEGPRFTTEEYNELVGILGLDRFRAEFLRFLGMHDLPQNICADDGEWLRFVTQYVRVIEDCPLVCQSNDVPAKYIDKIVISKEPGGFMSTKDGEVPFPISWAFYKCGKELQRWALQVQPRREEARFERKLTGVGSASVQSKVATSDTAIVTEPGKVPKASLGSTP